MITFETLGPDGAGVTGTVDAACERAWMIATDVSGNLCYGFLETFTSSALGSAVYISGSLGVFTSTITDIDGSLMVSYAPEFYSAFSQYVVPPVYIVNASLNPITLMANGYSITTGELEFALPTIKLISTDVVGPICFVDFEKFTSPFTGDIPELHNYFTLLQSSGFLDIAQATQSPWAIIQENLVGDTDLRADVGVTVVARAMASDGLLARADFNKFVEARATIYAQLNQAWYGAIDADATANLTLTEQVHFLASVFARCAASASPRAIAEMHLAITASVIAFAGASGKIVYPLVANATADVDTTVVYGAVGRILASLTASATASRYAVFLVAAEAEALASAGDSATASSFVFLVANGSAYVRVAFEGDDFEGWVLNTRPKGDEQLRGFTTYQDFPFTSFANFNGKQYGASAEGIFELTGNTDDGDPIPAWVRTALFDLESRRDKRMQTMYVGYTSDKRLVAKMITTNGGEKVETWYTMRAIQKAESTREARIEVGKGLHSVYWGFELHNEDGADFTLDVVALWPVYLDRRITNG